MKGAFTPDLTPVARRGQPVILDSGGEEALYEVERLGPLPRIESQEITVPDNSSVRNFELENLEMWEGWLGQYRFRNLADQLPDDVTLEVDQGGSQAPLFQNRNVRGSIESGTLTSESAVDGDGNGDVENLSHLAEFYVWGDEVPKLTLTNRSGASVSVEFEFFGFSLKLSSTSNQNGQPVYIPVESVRGE